MENDRTAKHIRNFSSHRVHFLLSSIRFISSFRLYIFSCVSYFFYTCNNYFSTQPLFIRLYMNLISYVHTYEIPHCRFSLGSKSKYPPISPVNFFHSVFHSFSFWYMMTKTDYENRIWWCLNVANNMLTYKCQKS